MRTDDTTNERAVRLAEINRIEGDQANRLNDGYAMPGMLGHALYADIETLLGIVRRLESENERQRETIGDLNAFDVPQALVDARLRINELEDVRARALELLQTGYYGKVIKVLESDLPVGGEGK